MAGLDLKVSRYGRSGWSLALRGKFQEYMEGERKRSATAATRGMKRAVRGLEKDLEAAFGSAGLGRLSRAWNSKIYPEKGVSQEPAGIVYGKGGSRTQGALDEHRGAVIRARNSRYLALSTPLAREMRGIGGERLSPRNWPEHRFGKLRFVHRPGKPALLVVENVRAGRRGIANLRTVKRKGEVVGTSLTGRITAVMFVLVPMTRLPERVQVDQLVRRWEARISALIEEEFESIPETRA